MSTSSNRPDTPPGTRPAVATACGKVILLGEHSVVYGEPGIAVPLLDMRLSVVLAAAARSWVPAGADSEPMRPPSPDGVVNSDQVETLAMPVVGSPEFERMAVDEGVGVMTLDGGELPPLSINVEDNAPEGAQAEISRTLGTAAQVLGVPVPLPLRVAVRAGGLRSGMGTSAALGTAMARALLAWYGFEPTRSRVTEVAAAVERQFHHNPSGIDHTVSVTESPVWFEKDKPPVPLSGLPPLRLVLLPRTSERATSDVVEGVQGRLVADASLVRVVAEMGRWSRDGREAWAAGDPIALGEAMNSQQRSLDRLGVVDASDREGVTAAMDAGALAAKITGAGCGGTLLALVTEETTSAVATAWGPDSLPVQIG